MNKDTAKYLDKWDLSGKDRAALEGMLPKNILLIGRRLDEVWKKEQKNIATEWLKINNKAFDGNTPLDVILTEDKGIDKVISYLYGA